jgi:hypothetical protein
MEKLQNQENYTISLNDRYNSNLEVLKQYNLISPNITAKDILEDSVNSKKFADENEL